MYCVFINLPAFRQITRVNLEKALPLLESIKKLANDSGAAFQDISSGRILLLYKSLRPGDASFMIENYHRYWNLISESNEFLAGYTLILEILGESIDIEATFGNLMLGAQDAEGAWFGNLAATQLASFAKLENRGRLWKVLGLSTNYAEPRDLPLTHLEKLMPSGPIVTKLQKIIQGRGGILFLESDRHWWLGSIVERSLKQILGNRNHLDYIWVRGIGQEDLAHACLFRHISSENIKKAEKFIPEEDVGTWNALRPLLLLGNAVPTSIDGSFISQDFQYFNKINAPIIWGILLKAWSAYCRSSGIPFILHLENVGEMPTWTSAFLNKYLHDHSLSLDQRPTVIASQAQGVLRDLQGEWLSESWYFQGVTNSYYPLSPVDAHTAALASYVQNPGTDGIFSMMGELEREILYAILITGNYLPLNSLTEILVNKGIERIRISPILERLHSLALTRLEAIPIPVFPSLTETLEPWIQEKAVELRAGIADFLIKTVVYVPGYQSYDLFHFAGDLVQDEPFLFWALELGEALVDRGMTGECSRVLDHVGARSATARNLMVREQYARVLSYLYCRVLLVENNAKELNGAAEHLRQTLAIKDTMQAWLQLQDARILYHKGMVDTSANAAKSAVMLFQDTNRHKGLAASHNLFGLILIARDKLIEARDYIHMARSGSLQAKSTHEEGRAQYLDLLVLFLQGYFSRVLTSLEDKQGPLAKAREHGRTDYILVFLYMQGRIWFELGSIQQAMVLFYEARDEAIKLEKSSIISGLDGWIARCLLLEGKTLDAEIIARKMEEGAESDLVMAEIFNATGRPDEALLRLATDPPRPMIHPENILDGPLLYLMENHLFMGNNRYHTILTQTDIQKATALKELGKYDEAIDILFAKSRSKQFSVFDPYVYQYYQTYSQMLRLKSDKVHDDANTILGKAVKFFQERASKIEDPAKKLAFTGKNKLNASLLAEARRHNLA